MTFQYCFDGSIKKVNNLSVSSPRTWGCFSWRQELKKRRPVFPTHVGVFLIHGIPYRQRDRLPHARGGVSIAKRFKSLSDTSSPRTWGCFFSAKNSSAPASVFPTHVGVFLVESLIAFLARGLPHARGGVSHCRRFVHLLRQSSPRTWGCFQSCLAGCDIVLVFPTHVGVFLFDNLLSIFFFRLPHARGGVSSALHLSQS